VLNSSGKILTSQNGQEFGFRKNEDAEILRADLIQALYQRLEKTVCEFSLTIAKIIELPLGLKVLFSNEESEDFNFVIAADGLHSSVMKRFFDLQTYQEYSLQVIIFLFLQ
jgi:2-polyprenyl-6-methoxyphenol hydroxylase-like FAD-dependent oxidoreductase